MARFDIIDSNSVFDVLQQWEGVLEHSETYLEHTPTSFEQGIFREDRRLLEIFAAFGPQTAISGLC